MNEITRYEVIKRNELNEINYFKSLMAKAYERGMLLDKDLEKLQIQLIELLKERIKKYNGIDSSSILVDKADVIMESNIYTISIYLKDFKPDDAVLKLKTEELKSMYVLGKKIIDRKLKACKLLYSKVITSRLNTYNETYNSTLIDGIKGFFKIYDSYYEAHNMKITADYPLYNNLIGKLEGIEFIEEYLNSIYYENKFCKNFKSYNIEHLLYSYSRNYKDLIINLFEIVFTASLGCILAFEDVSKLTISFAGLNKIYDIFKGKSKDEIYAIIYGAYDNIKNALFVDIPKLQKYIENGIDEVQFCIYNAFITKNLDKVFITQKIIAQ